MYILFNIHRNSTIKTLYNIKDNKYVYIPNISDRLEASFNPYNIGSVFKNSLN